MTFIGRIVTVGALIGAIGLVAYAQNNSAADEAALAGCSDQRAETLARGASYTNHNVEIQASDGETLAGTLSLPTDPIAGAVLLTVAGPNDRNQSFYGHCGFAILADHLARQGVASLRLDDRGMGASSGNWTEAGYELLGNDASLALAHLEAETGLEPGQLGFVGMSEGSVISARAAATAPDVGFAVLLSAPAHDTTDMFRAQIALLVSAEPEEIQARYLVLYEEFVALVQADPVTDETRSEMIRFLQGSGRALVPAYGFIPTTPEDQATLFLGEWYRAQMDFDADATYGGLSTPVLAVYGSLDAVAPPRFHKSALERALSNTSSTDIIVLEGLNHLLQTAQTGMPQEYMHLAESISPAALTLIADWITEVAQNSQR